MRKKRKEEKEKKKEEKKEKKKRKKSIKPCFKQKPKQIWRQEPPLRHVVQQHINLYENAFNLYENGLTKIRK